MIYHLTNPTNPPNPAAGYHQEFISLSNSLTSFALKVKIFVDR
jgi:hypothetical protein